MTATFGESAVLTDAIGAVAGYLLGSIPTAYIVVKNMTGEDIRNHGSGNVGASNAKRVAGNKAFVVVLLLDFLKGFLPVLASKILFPENYLLHVLMALFTVLGHSKSIFLKFSGGKSAATGLGGIMALAPVPGLIMAGLAFVMIKTTRIVSLASMTAAVLSPFLVYFIGGALTNPKAPGSDMHGPVEYVIYAAIVGLYVIFLHRANIVRLKNGTENRI